MIKYNDNNIYVGYIKQLLKDFNLPRCQVYKEEFKDLYDDKTVYIKDKFLYRGGKIVDSYEIDKKILNITDNYHINSNIYDSNTHKYLGDFLRFIRDYTGLNLMQMYNCFTNESPVNLKMFDKDTNYTILDTSDTNYQVFMIPIKYNQVYTIGLDCYSCVVMATGNYENSDVTLNQASEQYVQYESGTRFNKPFIFKSPEAHSSDDLLQEKTLKLFIRIPSSCKSSIVILEGDYTRGCDLAIVTNDSDKADEKQLLASSVSDTLFAYEVEGTDEIKYINYFISRPQLLYLNTGTYYLLADRLIEYLSRNVIDSNEEIEDNIKLIQRIISTNDFAKKYLTDVSDSEDFIRNIKDKYIPEFYGKWDSKIRDCLYNYVYKSKEPSSKIKFVNTKFDLLGYYDKDVESSLSNYNKEDKSYEI